MQENLQNAGKFHKKFTKNSVENVDCTAETDNAIIQSIVKVGTCPLRQEDRAGCRGKGVRGD